MEPERIYSTSQLVEALQSGLLGLKEQLQVLFTGFMASHVQRAAMKLLHATMFFNSNRVYNGLVRIQQTAP